MCETKTKKLIFGLFLVPLIALTSLFVSALHSNQAFAVNCTPAYSQVFSISDDGKTITEKDSGYKTLNANTNYQTCQSTTGTYTYAQDATSKNLFTQTNNGTTVACGDTVTFVSGPTPNSTTDAKYQEYSPGPQCIKGTSAQVSVKSGTAFDVNSFNTLGSAGSGGGTTTATTCSVDGIGWIVCPVIKFGAAVADAAFGFISSNFLETNTNLYSTTDSGGGINPTYQAWQWILGFANIIFVVIFLIIIFSQATGFGISNYGIKKMLPKLIVGVILINLSFFICQIMIDASNLIGYGLSHFFETAASGIKGSTDTSPLDSGTFFTDIAVGVVASVVGVYAAITIFGPVLLAAIVGLVMVFLFLVARQALIVIGIIVAPLAFAAWLLPNTEKLFKRWWKIFLDLLLIFPIIALVFGASKLVSKIISGVYSSKSATASVSGSLATASNVSGNGGNFIGQMIAAAVLVVPLFAIPFILKGVVDSIPVLGNVARKAYGGATGGARKRGQDLHDLTMGSFNAQKRAGMRNIFGRNRVQRDANGNAIFDKDGKMIGRDGNPLKRRTASQAVFETRKSLEDNRKSYEKTADENYNARAAYDPNSLAGKATRRTQSQEVRGSASHSVLESELSGEKANSSTQVGQWERTRLENTDVKKDFDLKTNNNYEESILNNPTSIAGQARRSAERQGVRSAATAAGFESELKGERQDGSTQTGQWERQLRNYKDTGTTSDKLMDNEWEELRTNTGAPGSVNLAAAGINQDELIRRTSVQRGLDQSRQLAVDQQTGNYAKALLDESDPTILNIAGGKVNPLGRQRARAYGEQAQIALHKKDVDAASSLFGNGSEAAYGAGLRVQADDSWAGVVRDTRGNILHDASGNEVLTTNQADLDALVLRANIGGSTRDLSDATRISTKHVQQYSTSPLTAEAALIQLADSGQLTAEQFYHYTNAARAAGATTADLQFMINQVNAAANTSYGNKASINAAGEPIYGGQKGGVSGSFKGTLDSDGVKGFKKMAFKDQSAAFDVDKATGALVPITDGFGGTKTIRRVLAKTMLDKMGDPKQRDAFNAGLVGVGRDIVELAAIQIAKEQGGIAESVDMDITNPAAQAVYMDLLNRQAEARNLRGPAPAAGGGTP
jgi:hypothetical protein